MPRSPLPDRDAVLKDLDIRLKQHWSYGIDTTPVYLNAARDLGDACLNIKISQARSYGLGDRAVADIVDRHVSPCTYRPW